MEVRARLARVTLRAGEERTPGERVADVRRILVVRHDRLGDLVLSLPALHAIGLSYPQARLTLMVGRGLAPLAQMVGGIETVLEAASTPRVLRRQVAAAEADLAVCISRGLEIARAVSRAGVPERIGTGYRLYSPMFNRRVVERRRAGARHECEFALSFAHRAGARATGPVFPLTVPTAARQGALQWLANQDVRPNFVLLHPGSGGSCPAWPPAHYVELARRLAAEGVRPVLSFGPADAGLAALFDAASQPVRGLPRLPDGLENLAAVLQRAGIVVSNSTGPLHLAAALGVPTLGFYPPWSTCGIDRWGPYAENGWGFVAEHGEAASWSRRDRRRCGAALMGGIRPGRVARATLSLLRTGLPD